MSGSDADRSRDEPRVRPRKQLPTLLSSRWLWSGVVLLVVGTGPLVVAIVYSMVRGDPNPNPVGPGICAGLTFWPSLGMIVAGLVVGHRRAKAQRNAPDQRPS